MAPWFSYLKYQFVEMHFLLFFFCFWQIRHHQIFRAYLSCLICTGVAWDDLFLAPVFIKPLQQELYICECRKASKSLGVPLPDSYNTVATWGALRVIFYEGRKVRWILSLPGMPWEVHTTWRWRKSTIINVWETAPLLWLWNRLVLFSFRFLVPYHLVHCSSSLLLQVL